MENIHRKHDTHEELSTRNDQIQNWGMDLIIYFDKTILESIRIEISNSCSLNSIGIVEFCVFMIKYIKKYWPKDPLHENLVAMLCQVFDCVDVDSRGIIHWDDFVSFALRRLISSFDFSFIMTLPQWTESFQSNIKLFEY